jgi:alkanesulfonate monooxygenase SsuD/methylene tetrahydromethanopterin reductase-like flavin-dependent oxidoreductase (luciferase family)
VAPPRADLDDIFKPERYEHMAQVLEAARFDGCFFADTLGLPDIYKGSFDTYLRYGGQLSYLDPMVGTPAMIADTMQDMFESEACDGFVLTPTISPVMWEEFARMLTPELQRRGLLRTEYTGATMRENLRS